MKSRTRRKPARERGSPARKSPRGRRARSARGRGPGARSIGGYLIERMHALGVNDVFGIPGDFVLGFYGMLERSPIRIVGTCSELNAGYAADAYARINGIGAVCVTYSVGGLSLINAIAGAYAEKSPVIVDQRRAGRRGTRGQPAAAPSRRRVLARSARSSSASRSRRRASTIR